MRMFPMQDGPPIPWETATVVYRAYAALYGTSQTLERLADRGGFGWAEVAAIFKEVGFRHPALHQRLVDLPQSSD